MNWQDISTAPQDGTEVLCWREDCGPFIAKYTSVDSFPLTQAEIDAMDEESLFHKDWFTQWPQAFRLDGSEAPTHWMPLPAAPGKESPAALNLEAAAMKLAEVFDYPWEDMPAEGRQNMRTNAEAVLLAASFKESP
ncbi:DUF551 domain-containing protein [Delftia acidovorans]|uniref:DUF551 domain-containing protein n=1 Tax=Delftia acidovorans TaxID=80866 RepID=UPI000F83D144|nr:DUF551 domain-containing protein [Delftia acidovorans]